MATTNEIVLAVYRDKAAPFDPSQSKTLYNPPVGRGFNVATIGKISNVVESGTTYGSFIYHETPGGVSERVLVTQASGAIITLMNA